MSEFIIITFFVLLIISIPISIYNTNKRNHENIRNYLTQKEATAIEIDTVWFDEDRNTGTYKVKYVDQKGNRRRTTCKIRRRDTDIYWKNPP